MPFRNIFRFTFVMITSLLLLLVVSYLLVLDSANPVSVNRATTLCVKASSKVAKGSLSSGISEQIQLWATWITGAPTPLASPTVQLLIAMAEHCLIPFGLSVIVFSGSLAAIFDPITAEFITLAVTFLAILGLLTVIGSLASLLINILIYFHRTSIALARFLGLRAPAGNGAPRQLHLR